MSAAFLKEKRLHKPTRKYIEEFLDKMSKDSKGRADCYAVTTSESRRSKVRSQNKHHHLRPRILASVPEDDLISENRTLAEFRKQRACRKKYASISVGESSNLHTFIRIITIKFEIFRRKFLPTSLSSVSLFQLYGRFSFHVCFDLSYQLSVIS